MHSFNQSQINFNPFITQFKVDPRDTKVLIPFQQINSLFSNNNHLQLSQPSSFINNQQKRIIRKWLSKVYEVVSGDAFMKYFQSQLTMDQTKSYASKNYLMNIHQFMLQVKNYLQAKKHLKNKNLKLQIFSFVNQQSKTIIGFLKDKFPQTQQVGSNQYLTKVVSKINYSTQIENDLLFQNKDKQCGQPKICFQFKENKNYNSDIMKVLNYLIGIARMPCKFSEVDDRMLAGSLIKSLLRIDTDKKYDFQGQHYQLTLMKGFQFMLQSIFNKNKGDQIQSKKQIRTKEDFIQFFTYENDSAKSIQFAIGQKLSDKIDLFSPEQIKQSSITIRNPAVLRVITKWAEQLRQILRQPYEKFIVNNKFVSKKGQILIFSKQTRKIMYQVVEEEQERVKKVFKQIQNIYLKNEQQIFQFQASEHYLNSYDTNLSVLAGRTQICIGRYMLIYLNQVIHSLMSIPIKTIQKMQNDTKFRLPEMERRKILSLNLITCKLSDLLRGKCKSKEDDIINIYRYIQKMSVKYPKIIKLIKVKDRLNTPNKDISLNFMFMEKVVCQLQLITAASSTIATTKDTRSSAYNSFNHLLYQLQRAEFGPIAEAAYIAAKYDPMINKNSSKIQQIEIKNKQKKDIPSQEIKTQQYLKPKNKKQSILITPFICLRCQKLKQADNNSFIPKKKNNFCNQCTLQTIYKKDFKAFISILLRNRNFNTQQIQLLSNVLSLVKLSSIKQLQDIQLGFMTMKNTNSPTSIFFRTVEVDGALHLISSNSSIQEGIKTKIPIASISLRDKGSRKKAIAKLNNYYILVFKKQYVKAKPPSKQLFHDKLEEDISLFCHCRNQQSCLLNRLQKQQFPIEKFRVKNNLKDYDQCLQKMGKRLYMNDRKIDDVQLSQYPMSTQIQQAQFDKNNIETIKLLSFFEKITRLLLDDNKIKSLKSIVKVTCLKQLSIARNMLESLEGIQNFQNLQILDAQSNQIVQLPTFQNNLKIQRLKVDKNKIEKLIFSIKLVKMKYISCLPDKQSQKPQRLTAVQFDDYLPNLQTLNIQIAQYTWLKPLQKMKKLKSIFCVDSPWLLSCRNFTYIGKSQGLQRMQINNCDLTELDWAKNLLNLIFLDISNNKITSLKQLKNMEKLINLQCSNNQITDFENPNEFKNLKFLYMNRNKLKSAKFIEKMVNLECFEGDQNQEIVYQQDNVYKEQINTSILALGIENMQKKTYQNHQLNKLYLGQNKINTFQFIQKFNLLTSLQMRFNSIESFILTDRNINLTEIDLQFNKIEVFHVKSLMPNLTKVDIHQNRVKTMKLDFTLEYLKELIISNNMIEDLSFLSKLPALNILNCNQNCITKFNINASKNYQNKNQFYPIFNSLKKLHIARNRLKTLKQVNNFVNLEILQANNNLLQALQTQSTLKRLKNLNIQDNPNLKSLKDINKIKSLEILNCCTNNIQELFDNHPNIQNLQMDIKHQDQIQSIKRMKKLRKLELHCHTDIAAKVNLRVKQDLAKRLQFKIHDYITVPPLNKKQCVTCGIQFSQDPNNQNFFYYWRYWHENKDLQCIKCFESSNDFNKAILLNSVYKGQFNSTLLGRSTTAKLKLNEIEKESPNSQIFPYYICGLCKDQKWEIRYICLIEGQGLKGYADYCDSCLKNTSTQKYEGLQNGHRKNHPLLRMRHNYFYQYGRETGYFYY